MPSSPFSNPFPRKYGASSPSLLASNPHIATVSSHYRRLLKKNPFVFFGLPFVVTVVAGSFFLTPAAAVRYERFDRKTHMLDREAAMEMGRRGIGSGADDDGSAAERRKRKGREVDIREEYWKLAGRPDRTDEWEPVRVKRRPGEPDGTFG